MSENPDMFTIYCNRKIIHFRLIGTPGRIVHVLKEVGMSLKSVEYAVFDEADRLLECTFKMLII